MMLRYLLPLVLAIWAGENWAGNQKILVRLREPLRAESVKILIPEVSNGKGETRDLETRLELGNGEKVEPPQSAQPTLKLALALRPAGGNGLQVTLTMPRAGFVELLVLDFYGKNLATLLEANLPAGVHDLAPFEFKEAENNGIKFLALRINGKVAMKRVMTKVR